MKRFRYLRSVKKTYNEQGAIYFACADIRHQPRTVREKVERLCARVGGEFAPALMCYLTTDTDWITVCDRYNLSSATLERLRRAFYEAW